MEGSDLVRLGVRTQAAIRLTHSMLPESVPYVRITGFRVGSAEVSLEITRRNKTVSTAILNRRGEIDIVATLTYRFASNGCEKGELRSCKEIRQAIKILSSGN
jgi:hypothetical protein